MLGDQLPMVPQIDVTESSASPSKTSPGIQIYITWVPSGLPLAVGRGGFRSEGGFGSPQVKSSEDSDGMCGCHVGTVKFNESYQKHVQFENVQRSAPQPTELGLKYNLCIDDIGSLAVCFCCPNVNLS